MDGIVPVFFPYCLSISSTTKSKWKLVRKYICPSIFLFYEVIVLALNFGFIAICFSSQKVKFVWSAAFFPIRFILLMEKFLDSKYTKAEFDFDVQIFWIWLTFWNGNGNGKGQAITSFLWIFDRISMLAIIVSIWWRWTNYEL